MNYGIDVNALTRDQYTGVEKYLHFLIKEMMEKELKDNERVFLYSSKQVKDLNPLPKGWKWKILKFRLPKGWTHMRLSWELFFNPPDVFFSPAHEIPLFCRTKIVNTVHDIAFIHVPEVYTNFERARQKWAVKRALKKSNKVISVSETTKQDLIDFYNIEKSKVKVVHLGVLNSDYQSSSLEAQVSNLNDYFITVGRIEKKKNIDFLIKAFEQFKLQNRDSKIELILVGKFGSGGDEIKEQIKNSKFKDQIKVLGYIPDKDLMPLISGAEAYFFPSNYEGFGLTMLEAMSVNTPVIASSIPALREVGADAALFSELGDLDSWVLNMQRIISNQALRDDLIQKGSQRVKDFNWEKTAKQTWEVLEEVAYA